MKYNKPGKTYKSTAPDGTKIRSRVGTTPGGRKYTVVKIGDATSIDVQSRGAGGPVYRKRSTPRGTVKTVQRWGENEKYLLGKGPTKPVGTRKKK